MKKIILFILTLFLSLMSSQAQTIDAFFQKYKTKKDVKYVNIPPTALKLISKIAVIAFNFNESSTVQDRELTHFISSISNDIKKVHFMFSKNKSIDLQKTIRESNLLDSKNYKLLNMELGKDEDLFIYSDVSEGKTIHNLVFVINDKTNNVSVISSLEGNIELVKIAEFIEATRNTKKEQ